MGKNLKVLIVEDSADDGELLLRELRRLGYAVTSLRVETAEEMNAALDDGGWDLVISDYQLPAFSGPEALGVLRRRDPDMPFIVVSGTIGEETAVETMR